MQKVESGVFHNTNPTTVTVNADVETGCDDAEVEHKNSERSKAEQIQK
jgi:hypothetical protein